VQAQRGARDRDGEADLGADAGVALGLVGQAQVAGAVDVDLLVGRDGAVGVPARGLVGVVERVDVVLTTPIVIGSFSSWSPTLTSSVVPPAASGVIFSEPASVSSTLITSVS
jgi:hypothetical protein